MPHVHEATLRVESGVDPAAVGAAVTIELCGAVDHGGNCRWPHNNDIEPDGAASTFRTLFVADPFEADEVHERISLALRSSNEWFVTAEGRRPLEPDEELLAARLANTPL